MFIRRQPHLQDSNYLRTCHQQLKSYTIKLDVTENTVCLNKRWHWFVSHCLQSASLDRVLSAVVNVGLSKGEEGSGYDSENFLHVMCPPTNFAMYIWILNLKDMIHSVPLFMHIIGFHSVYCPCTQVEGQNKAVP